MKKTFTLSLFLLTSFLFTTAFANQVYVSGYVKNNGVAVANKAVKVWVDSSVAGNTCYQVHIKYTNSIGFYNDTLNCSNANITVVKTSIEGCSGALVINSSTVNANNATESNFNLTCTSTSTCTAYYTYAIGGNSVQFTNASVANSTVVSYVWYFGDGVFSSLQNPTHIYAVNGIYTACLKITSSTGCSDSICKTVTITGNTPPPFVCTAVAGFTYIPVSALVKFNSNISTPGINDTIISRKWVFGDNSAALTGNIVDPQHQYAQPGIYNACLTIKTVKGCERTFCAIVTATNVNSNCVPQFTYQRVAPKKASFNSTVSWVPLGDSIVERKWTFGDGTSLTGAFGANANPIHEYANLGVYTVCLRIKTALGCVNEVCKPVVLQDSVVAPPAGVNEPIKIISLYPNPVTIQLNTVIWSFNNNVAAELAIYDIYGAKKWSINKTLLQGNNYTVIPTAYLAHGPYYFRVTTSYGVKSRSFYKL